MSFWRNILLKLLLTGFVLFTIYGHVWLIFLDFILKDLSLRGNFNSYLALFASIIYISLSMLYFKELFFGYNVLSKRKTYKSLILISILAIPYFSSHPDFIINQRDGDGIEMYIILIVTILVPFALIVHRILALRENK